MARHGHAAMLAAGLLVACAAAPAGGQERGEIRVGSKKFTESVVLGEMAAQLLRDRGFAVRHLRELGGTRLLWNALLAGEIDLYVEYTGTLHEEIFAGRELTAGALTAALGEVGVLATRSLGFNNTYAIGMAEDFAASLGIRTISDLAAHPDLVFGFNNEFLDRGDGWPSLRARYGLPQREVRGLDHDLAYPALASGAIRATDLYSTDAEIALYGLRVLADDRGHFPDYHPLILYRRQLPAAAAAALRRLEGAIDDRAMVAMNARAKLERVAESRVAADFLAEAFGISAAVEDESRAGRLLRSTREHLTLVAISLVAAVLLAIPCGVLAARRPRLGQLLLGAVGILQTIPSLALLVFMIPLFGIGAPPALAALFLYSLLPIVRNTYTGLRDIPPELAESAAALGLPPTARLRWVELPLASRSILAGIKTSAVINIGTATLGALIGAGGYGQPILTGIRLDDLGLILEGAIPAALLALAAQGFFELAERVLVPKGLRLP
ncbi:MAG: ABC transporter permease subunit [Acidobacteriota bacterium]|nr:ABC transporter permease subunit [Acidobacteriota bacterium]MDH3522511.1 ABC transporter permease subunit [Acidobacteriota bacterium]